MQLPSILLENAVAEFAKLPGIGKKNCIKISITLIKKR
jgi:recombination protein RecR